MGKRPFFFHHQLGFRRNPFGALVDEEWAAIAVLPDAIEELLPAAFTHLQLLGAKGCGKTTSLLKLADYFSETDQHLRIQYEYLAEGERRMHSDTAVSDLFFLDEAQRLNRRARRQLLTSIASRADQFRLVFSSHKDLSPHFARKGISLHTIHLEKTVTLAQYKKMLRHRLEYFALPDKKGITIAPDAVQFLYDTFFPNFRAAEYFLYDVWQRQTAVCELTAVDLQRNMPD